jgi:hypothetical protein
VPAEVLRAALAAYVATVPNAERLAAHLRDTDRLASLAPIRQRLDAVVDDVERLFRTLPRRSAFDADAEAGLLAALARRHDWLDATASAGLLGFLRWYAWHEGYLGG